jgi:hypothetical protein
MKKDFKLTKTAILSFITIMVLAPLLAFGQEAVAATDMGLIQKVMEILASYKTLPQLALAAAIVQLLLYFFNTPIFGKLFSKLDGGVKLIIVTLLSIIAGLLTAKISGVPLADAFLSSANLAALQVFAHQIYFLLGGICQH